MEQFLLTARDVMPTLRGIKFSDKDLVQMSECLKTKDSKGRNYNVLFGCDEQVLGALALGAHGAIGTTYNLLSGLNRRLLTSLNKGDVMAARAEQYRSQAVIKQIFAAGDKSNGILGPMKAMMSLVGCDVGTVRPPMRDLETKDKEDFFGALKDLGFLDWRKE